MSKVLSPAKLKTVLENLSPDSGEETKKGDNDSKTELPGKAKVTSKKADKKPKKGEGDRAELTKIQAPERSAVGTSVDEGVKLFAPDAPAVKSVAPPKETKKCDTVIQDQGMAMGTSTVAENEKTEHVGQEDKEILEKPEEDEIEEGQIN